jgi:hypothetical protein
LKRRQQRARIDLEDAARHLLDSTRDAEPVHRLEAEGLQNQHVEGALDHIGGRSVHADDDADLHLVCQDVTINLTRG